MSAISWFPGHMHKARKEIGLVMKKVNLVVELLDARTPFSSENPLVEGLRGETPLLKVLNKCDLADPNTTELWLKYLNAKDGVRAMTMQATEKKQTKKVLKTAHKMLNLPADRQATLLVLGIPNVGKSTLINSLAGRTVCKTGDTPAITRQQQLIPLEGDRFNLMDTPGFLWPKLAPESCAYRLAITGAIRDVAFDYMDISFHAVTALQKLYPQTLIEKFNCSEDLVADLENPAAPRLIMEKIATRNGFLQKGGVPDIERSCEKLLYDLRKGSLGRITWETPAMIDEENLVEGKIEGIKGSKGREERRLEKKRERKLERAKKTNDWESFIID